MIELGWRDIVRDVDRISAVLRRHARGDVPQNHESCTVAAMFSINLLMERVACCRQRTTFRIPDDSNLSPACVDLLRGFI